MKKILVLVIALFLVNVLFSQNYYYYFGEKIFLQTQSSEILIVVSNDYNKKDLYNEIEFDGIYEMPSDETAENNYFIIEAKDNSTLEVRQNSLNIIRANPNVYCANFLLNHENMRQGITNEFIVKVKSQTTRSDFLKYLDKNNCSIISKNAFVENQFLISIPSKSNRNTMQFANQFFESGLFEFAEPNFLFFDALCSNDQYYNNQWSLKNTGQNGGVVGADINIEQAWGITEGSSNITIAVLDQGVELSHPDLMPNLLAGYDATGNNTAGGPYNATGNDKDVADFHGTSCAGIISAVKDNGIGISGVAPQCKIVPINASVNGHLSNQALADGLEWAWNPNYGNADIISNSWMTSQTAAITNAVNNAVTFGRAGLGCVVLFSSGNYATPSGSSVRYPANLTNVIAVGASSNNDTRESYSDYGAELDVVAPGGNFNIYSTDITGINGYNNNLSIHGGDYTSTFSGTSAACPHAAGIIGLMLSVNRCLTWQEAKNILELSADKVGLYCYNSYGGYKSIEMGHGRVNAYKAVQYAHSVSINTYTNIIGIDQGAGSSSTLTMVTGCSSVAAGNYSVVRHKVQKAVTYPNTEAPIIIGTSNGLSAASPNNGNYWLGTQSVNETSAILYCYVYETYDILNRFIGWVPCSPSNIRFQFNVLSENQTINYLQNQTISTGSEAYNAMNMIIAGNNVTSLINVGDFIVDGASNVTLHAGNTIKLEPGTKVSSVNSGYFRAFIGPFFTCTQYPNGRIGNGISINTQYSNNNETGDSDIEINNNINIKSYPNPFVSGFTIEYQLSQSNDVTITIFDSFGKPIYVLENSRIHNAGSYSVRISNLDVSPGVYFLNIKTEHDSKTIKIVKYN